MTSSELLPLSRATWSVLHDRHYFHHHRHRPHNFNLLRDNNQLSSQEKRIRHISKRYNTLECNNQSTALAKTSSSSQDPGSSEESSRLSRLLQPSNIDNTSTYWSNGVTSNQRSRCMCGKSSYFICRRTIDPNRNSDSFFHSERRSGFSAVRQNRVSEVAAGSLFGSIAFV
jgi:hypothetical protein